MSSPISKIALCSPTGKLGPFLLQALKTEGFQVTVILRASSTATFPADQMITKVSDQYHKDELVSAFRGHDAVVLSLSFEMLPHAKKFAEASINAGNRWLVASTYGANLEDPQHAIFPASIPHRQALDDLTELQKGQDNWAWTSISCGPWPELSIAASAWNINPTTKTAELVDGGTNIFTSTTRSKLSLAVARLLLKQPSHTRNTSIHVASFEVSMLTWLEGYKRALGSEGWTITEIDAKTLIERSQAQLAAGNFAEGYMGTALAVCTGPGFQNRFSKFATLVNEELELGQEDLDEVVKEGLGLPNPFA